MYLQSFAEKLEFYAFFLLDTPDYLINIGVSLLSFFHFSSHCILIPYPTFIDFTGNIHPISLKTEIFMKLINFVIFVVNCYHLMFVKSRPFWIKYGISKPLFQPLWQVIPFKGLDSFVPRFSTPRIKSTYSRSRINNNLISAQ